MNNEERDFLLNVFERFGDKAQAAMDFVKRNEKTAEKKDENTDKAAKEPQPVPAFLPNGVYYVLKDGTHMPVLADGEDGEEPESNTVAFIGIAYDTHKFGVPLNANKGKHKLLNCVSNYPERDGECMNEADAILDWDFVRATEHIKELGTDIPLKEGEYIPTIPVFLAMYKYRAVLNRALKNVGGTMIDFDSDTWFARRYYSYNAWIFSGNNGSLGDNNVSNTILVQAVTLWK